MSERIPGANPDDNINLQDEDPNSLVESNSDEKSEDVPEFDPEAAQRRIDEAKKELNSEGTSQPSENPSFDMEYATKMQEEALKLAQDDPEKFRQEGWSTKNLGEKFVDPPVQEGEAPVEWRRESLEDKKSRLTEEFSQLSKDEIPEGVRDAQDYVEYSLEQEAHNREREEKEKEYVEKMKSDQDFLREIGCDEDGIRRIFYDRKRYSKEDRRDGETEAYSYQKKPATEYFLQNVCSVKDLLESGIFNVDDAKSTLTKEVESFIYDVHDITDLERYPEFNESQETSTADMISGIIKTRKEQMPLEKEQRDFIYSLYNERFDCIRKFELLGHNFIDTADTLLFGKGNISSRLQHLSEEVGNISEDFENAPDSFKKRNYVDRLVAVEQRISEIDSDNLESENLERLDQTKEDVTQLILLNIPAIEERIDWTIHWTEDYSDRIENHDPDSIWNVHQLRQLKGDVDIERVRIGEMLLRNCSPKKLYLEDDLGKVRAVKTGEMMRKCSVESDRILDTDYGGPDSEDKANYEPSPTRHEALNVYEILEAGIPKEDLIENIRYKNSRENKEFIVPITHQAIEMMRKAGFNNRDILRCYGPTELADLISNEREMDRKGLPRFNKPPIGYRDKGFSDQDILDYLAEEALGLDRQVKA